MTKNYFDLEKSYESAINIFFEDIKGRIFYSKKLNYSPALVVDASLSKSSKIFKLKLLVNETVLTVCFGDFAALRKDLKTPKEFQEKKPIIDALRKGKESLEKSRSTRGTVQKNRKNIRYV